MGRDESPSRVPLTLRVVTTPPAPGRSEAPSYAAPSSEAAAEAPVAAAPAPPSPPTPAPVSERPRAAGTVPALPVRSGAPAPKLPYGRVVAVFLGSFGLTTAVVLGVWFGLVREGRSTVDPTPVPAPVFVISPAPAVAVTEPAADLIEEVADADIALDPLDTPTSAAVEPPPPAPAPRRPPPTVVVLDPPRPVAEPAPEPARVAATAPAPSVPEAAARHAGSYVGRVQTRPMSLDLVFRPDGKLAATIRVGEGTSSEEIKANGTWTLTGDAVTIALVESGAPAPRVWSGRVADGEIDGRLVEDARTSRRFNARR